MKTSALYVTLDHPTYPAWIRKLFPFLPTFPPRSPIQILGNPRHLPKPKDDQVSVKPLETTNMNYHSVKAQRPESVLVEKPPLRSTGGGPDLMQNSELFSPSHGAFHQ